LTTNAIYPLKGNNIYAGTDARDAMERVVEWCRWMGCGTDLEERGPADVATLMDWLTVRPGADSITAPASAPRPDVIPDVDVQEDQPPDFATIGDDCAPA